MDYRAKRRISRRTFLSATAAGGGLLLTGGIGSVVRAVTPTQADPNAPWFEATILQLRQQMQTGSLTSEDLTRAYLHRIAELNPLLGAVIETNPDAIEIARLRDAERRSGRDRGVLHGIPILVKDNILTEDRMQSTAGSLALVDVRVTEDAPVVERLRKHGAVILGKTNLSEWANFRGFPPPDFPFDTNSLNGWSARGGFTYNPYLLSFDPCGSSSGSGVAPAVNMAAAAIGTETDGSIVCPAGNNQVVGLKPTVGLVPAAGIIPIAHSQDTAGPMARTVEDVAVLMNVLARPSLNGVARPKDYTQYLDPNGLQGARIGIERRQFLPEYFALPEINAAVELAIDAMAAAGAVIVDPVDTGDTYAWYDAEFVVLLYEFKYDIDRFLRGSYLRNSPMRSLGDLIQFNIDHCPEEMKYFGQEIFELAEATGGDLTSTEYLEARALCLDLTRTQGIDRVMAEHDLDAVLSPSYAFGSSAPACAGYPVISVPVGFAADGKPAGVWMYAGFMQEPQLIRIGHAIETLLQPRAQQPQFLGAAPPEPADAGICAMLPNGDIGARIEALSQTGALKAPAHPRTGRPLPIGR